MDKRLKALKSLFIALIVIAVAGISGCLRSPSPDDYDISSSFASQPGLSSDSSFSSPFDDASLYPQESEYSIAISENEALSVENIPDYSGYSFITVNDNVPFFTGDDITTEVFEIYSDQDDLGRCGAAYANVCKELMPTEKRGEIGMIRPSGWQTVKYAGVVDGNYLYNRCHLIGYQLAGENANEDNLITGTRWFNVQGMLPFENAVADYVKNTENHVLYRVTPVYNNDGLVALGVEMEALSVEDDSICYNVFVYNIQPGIEIDYSTGVSCLDDEYEAEIAKAEEKQGILEEEIDTIVDGSASNIVEIIDMSGKDLDYSGSDTEDEKEETYILNTNTKKFHYPSCSSAENISEKNKESFVGTRSELLLKGYKPCGSCNP